MRFADEQWLVRQDASAKVSGRARYTGDLSFAALLHAAFVPATVAHGRVTHIDSGDARSKTGVFAVLTHEDDLNMGDTTASFLKLLQTPTVHFHGQPIALVLARTAEEARFAATRVVVFYEALPAVTHIGTALDPAYTPKTAGHVSTDSSRGDPTGAYDASEIKLDHEYRTAAHNHHPIEPHCVTVCPDGEGLVVYTTTSAVFATRLNIAESLRVDPGKVRVVCEYLGGGFGAKGGAWYSCQTLLAVVARRIQRNVRLELSRAEMFSLVGRRQETVQRLRIGADLTGKLCSIRHDTVAQTSAFGEYADPVGTVSRMLYACEHVAATHRLIRTHEPQPNPMRAPGEGPGSFALETALDELACELQLDPIELRLRNYVDVDQHAGLPFSSNGLEDCYRVAAEAFGWQECLAGRCPRRDGHLLIGHGMASACYPVYRNLSEASVRLKRDGSVEVRCGTQDVGGGTYTVLGQLVANVLHVPVHCIHVYLGDTTLPQGPPSAGAMATASFVPAVDMAARRLRERLLASATSDPDSPHYRARIASLTLLDGGIVSTDSGRGEGISIQAGRLHEDLEATCRTVPDAEPSYSSYSHGAIFAEVSVDPLLGEVRVRRITAAYASGRILNPRFARSQYIGGLIAGIGMTLHEEVQTDKNLGRIVNASLSDYLLPVHADMPVFDIHLVEQDDRYLAHGVKGVGMIGAVGVSAAIGNAVYAACKRRVRQLPIRLEHILQ